MKRANSVEEWIAKAEGDYETVIDLFPKRRPRQRYIIAFHCQQCAEKYLKALLTLHKISFPKNHDLEVLLTIVLQADPLLAPIQKNLSRLTPFAVEFRYPGEEVIASEVSDAVKIIKQLRKIFRKRLGLKIT